MDRDADCARIHRLKALGCGPNIPGCCDSARHGAICWRASPWLRSAGPEGFPPAVQPSPNDHIHLDPQPRQMSGFVSNSLDRAEPVARDEDDRYVVAQQPCLLARRVVLHPGASLTRMHLDSYTTPSRARSWAPKAIWERDYHVIVLGTVKESKR